MRLFGAGRPDHPMADRKEARRILDALPAQDLKALEELAHWHESAGAAAGFKPEERAQVLALIDEAAQRRLKKLAADYWRAGRVQQNLLWARIHEYWAQAGQAYVRAEFPVGALRALGQQLKWQQLRYGPIDLSVWGLMNRIFAAAENVPACKSEFLKAALLGASAMDSRPASDIELAERLIDEFAPALVLAKSPAPGLPFWIDLGRAMAPARSQQPPQPAPGLRFLGPGGALAQLHSMMKSDDDALLGVVRHLAAHWAAEPPVRKHKRHSMTSSLKIAYGFEGVIEALGGASDSLDFGGGGAAESWMVENVSAGGFGALVSQGKSERLKVGALLAAKPDGASGWMVGAVRRLSKISPQEMRVGVQTLSRAPALSEFALRNAQTQGVLLPAAPGEAAIALRAGVYARGENLETTIGGRQHVYMPQGTPERGEDYEILRFKEMIRES